MRRPLALAALTFAALATVALTACAPVDDAAPSGTAAGGSESAESRVPPLASHTDGLLTIRTSDPLFEPWVVGNDPAGG